MLLQNSFCPAIGRSISILCFSSIIFVLISGCAAYKPPTATTEPAISLSATSLNFKTVVVGQTQHQTLHLSNTGTAPLEVTGLPVTDKQFTISGPSVPRVVLPNMGLDYTLSFTPTVAGNAAATLKIASNAVNSVVAVSLAGTGEKVVSAVQVSPSAISFGTLTLETTSTKSVTLQNSGDVNITISGITVVGAGFGYTNLSPGYSLAPNQAVTFQVWFKPTVKGSASGTLSLLSANLSSPETMSLSGTGASSSPNPSPPPPSSFTNSYAHSALRLSQLDSERKLCGWLSRISVHLRQFGLSTHFFFARRFHFLRRHHRSLRHHLLLRSHRRRRCGHRKQ